MSVKKQHIIEIGLSAGIAVIFLVITYYVMNLRIPITSEKAKIQLFEVIKQSLFPQDQSTMTDSIIMIDTHYDQQFVMEHVPDSTQTPKGIVSVTDRTKLLRCLNYLKKHNDYRYILMDIILDKAVSQKSDSTLYRTISSMKRICIAKPHDCPLADSCLNEKAGVVQYKLAIWENDFVKYPYYTDYEKSLPLKMYEELTGNSINRHWFFYTDNALARNTVILTFNNVDIRERTYLGGMNNYSIEEILEDMDTKGKYILIGDFEDDLHNTFLGEIPGTMINYNAFLSLLSGHHRITFGTILFLVFVFALPIYFKITRYRHVKRLWVKFYSKFKKIRIWLLSFLKKRVPYTIMSWIGKIYHLIAISVLWRFLGKLASSIFSSWVGYPLYLIIVCWIYYVCFNEVYDMLITTLLFYLLDLFMDSYFEKQKAKQKI